MRLFKFWLSRSLIGDLFDSMLCKTTIVEMNRQWKLVFVIAERITPSWSSRHCLLWPQKGILRSFGRETRLCESIGDISVVMQDRAQQGCYTSKVSKKTLQPILDPPILSGQCKAVTWPLISLKILHLFIIPNTSSALAHRLLGYEYLSVLWVVLKDNYLYVQAIVSKRSGIKTQIGNNQCH